MPIRIVRVTGGMEVIRLLKSDMPTRYRLEYDKHSSKNHNSCLNSVDPPHDVTVKGGGSPCALSAMFSLSSVKYGIQYSCPSLAGMVDPIFWVAAEELRSIQYQAPARGWTSPDVPGKKYTLVFVVDRIGDKVDGRLLNFGIQALIFRCSSD